VTNLVHDGLLAIDNSSALHGEMGFGHLATVTSISQDLANHDLYVVGFTMPRFDPDLDPRDPAFDADAGVLFTTPTLAVIGPDATWSALPPAELAVASSELSCHDLALPISVMAPNECVLAQAPQPQRLNLETDPVSRKLRYLSFTVQDVGRTGYVRVMWVDMPPAFAGWEGLKMYASEPEMYCENAGVDQCEGMPGCCPDVVGGLDPKWFWAAKLQCEPPDPVDWNSYGVVHVFHEGIVPGGVYHVQLADSTCSPHVDPSWSDPLVVGQSAWCDLVVDCSTFPCGPPDGVTGIVDVTAILDKYKNLPGNVIKARADVEGCPAGNCYVADRLINISDVTYCLGAFLGDPFPPPGFPPPGEPPHCAN
jgi:hypothetical protein